MRHSDEEVFYELDIPDSVYDEVKTLCKDCFSKSQVVLVEMSSDWDRACSIIHEDLKQLKVSIYPCMLFAPLDIYSIGKF